MIAVRGSREDVRDRATDSITVEGGSPPHESSQRAGHSRGCLHHRVMMSQIEDLGVSDQLPQNLECRLGVLVIEMHQTVSQFSESSASATHRHPPNFYLFIDLYAQTKSISTKMPIN